MYHKIYNVPVAHHLFKNAGAIPIATQKEDPELLEKAYNEIAAALDNGELVCIFPEGGLTPDGSIQSFKPGIERILQRTPVPVVPMALSGLWGTWFSRIHGRAMKGWPRNWLKKIDVYTGEPISTDDISLPVLEQNIAALRNTP